MEPWVDHEYWLESHGRHTGYGVMIHTTGDGPPKRAHKNGTNPRAEAHAWYRTQRTGPHFLVGCNGHVTQYRSIHEEAWHVGMSASERRDLLSGRWEGDGRCFPTAEVKRQYLHYWKDRWSPRYKSPAHLYPSRRPNEDYIGIETVPCGTWVNGTWKWLWGTPMTASGRFSVEQYLALARICVGVAARLGLPEGWQETGRLVGHEDVNPYTRPGWDPGACHERFSWTILKAMVRVISNGRRTDYPRETDVGDNVDRTANT